MHPHLGEVCPQGLVKQRPRWSTGGERDERLDRDGRRDYLARMCGGGAAVTDVAGQCADAVFGRYTVPALQRGLAILGLFAGGRSVITVPDITRKLSISRATAFRLVCTLEQAGFLERSPNAHAFRLGRQSLAISFEYLNSLDVVDVARPLLEQLRDEVGATAHLGIRHGTAMMYLLRAASQHELVSSLVVPVGTRCPVHAVACGRALLFDFSDAELDSLFDGFDFGAYSAPAPQILPPLRRC